MLDGLTPLREREPENLLPLGAILRTTGALLLTTATVLVTAFAQEWIAGLVKRFFP